MSCVRSSSALAGGSTMDKQRAKKAKAAADSEILPATSNLVVPHFVQNRTFAVNGETSNGGARFAIRELLPSASPGREEAWIQYDTSVCDLDLKTYGRIIGKINVIACQDDHVVLQVIFNGQQGISFIYANLVSGFLQMIPTEVQYFPWNIVYKGNVQCLLSPDLSCALFGLPHNYMSPTKNFKLLLSDIVRRESHLQFEAIKDTRFSLKKFKMVAFDPRKPHHVVLVHLNPYCYKCSIEMWDMKDNVCVMTRKIIKTGNSTVIAEQQHIICEDAMLRTAEYSSDIQLLQAHMTYSKAGRFLIISCLGILTDFIVPQVRVIILDSDTFQVIKNVCFLLDGEQPLPNLFVSSIDDADTKVIIWSQIRERLPQKVGEINLPPDLSLQGICKKIILTNCAATNIDQLPLPQKLIRVLQFKLLQ